ncbi:MAG: PIG-L family deacetylase, partial [Candidatus Aenigmarchaeota archaeon]|nr:PIG-L family deacetylase [Candidatus Aenigmarchaeota archaeon]
MNILKYMRKFLENLKDNKVLINIFKKIYNSVAYNSNFLKASRFLYFSKTNPEPFELKTNDKCLLLAPHPDDEAFGCGGVLIKYPDNFHVVCLTNGIHSSFDKNPNHNEIKKIREQE